MRTCVPLYMFYKQLRINIKILMIISKAGLRDDLLSSFGLTVFSSFL